MKRSIARCLALVLATVPALAADPPAPVEQHWEPVGWGGGGFYWATAYHPTDPAVLYLGGDVAGVYKTTDQGRHWRFANQGLHNYGVYGLAIATSAPDTVYAQTLDGLAKTRDGGAHWQFMPETGKAKLNLSASRGGSVRPVAIDPSNAEVVYAGGATGRLAKTTDGGQTWQPLPYLETAFAGPPSLATTPPACTGQGFLVLTYASEAGDWAKNGRVEKALAYPQGADWSGYRKLTARVFVPPGAPKIEAQLVVQTGDDWLWQQGPWAAGRPGEWTETALSFDGLKSLEKVRIAYVVIRSPEGGYQGEIFLDSLALHSSAETALVPGAAAPPDGVTLLADWEKPGDADGWRANQKISDALYITGARQSSEPAVAEKGVIASVAVAPGQSQLVYAASTVYGLLRSEDAGATWTHLAAAPRGVVGITPSPHDPNLVYVACGQEGVHRSTDRGATWTPLREGLDPKAGLREVVVDPRRPAVLHAIASLDWNGTYYRSDDGGAHWTANRMMSRDLTDNPTLPDETGGGAYPAGQATFSRPTNLAISPANPDLLFCSGNWRNVFSADGGRTWQERSRGADITCAQDIQFRDGKVYVVAMDEGLLVSDDRGGSWRQLAPLKYSDDVSGHQWRVRLLPGGGIVSTVFPWAGQPNAVLRSDDGRTFTKHATGLPTYIPKPNTMWGQGYARALAVDPANPDIMYLGIDGDAEPDQGRAGGGIFRSADGGRTWQQLVNQPGSRRMFYGLAVDPTDSRRLFWGTCGTGGGVWRSEDGGESWSRVFSNEGWVFNVEVTGQGVIYAGGNNLWRSDDHGTTWRQVTRFPNGPVVVGIAYDPDDPQRLWISRVTWGEGAAGGAIHATADGGRTWTEITGDIAYRKPLVLRYDAVAKELWAGGVGLFKTTP